MIRIEHIHRLESAPGVDAKLESILTRLSTLGDHMNASLQRLTTEVAETKTIAASAVTLLNGLGQQIRDLKDDPAALEALADELDASQQELAAAVTANTDPAPVDPNA